jgi:Ulp1 family protease
MPCLLGFTWLPLFIFPQVPQQKNDYDCGLFVLFFMERFIEEAPERLKKKDLDMVHYFVIYCCIRNVFL